MLDSAGSLGAWQVYYTLLGTSAATLIGLTFVVITLVGTMQKQPSTIGISVFTTPTVVHFGTALLASLFLCAPWKSSAGAAAIVAVVAIVGLVLALRAAMLSRQMDTYTPDVEDLIWFSILPVLTYVVMLAGAAMLAFHVRESLFVIACAVAFLIVMGIRNSWDVVTYVTTDRD